jgi:hypothetical protein
MMNWPHLQIDALKASKGPLHYRETLIVAHRFIRREQLLGNAGAQHVDPIQRSFFGNAG